MKREDRRLCLKETLVSSFHVENFRNPGTVTVWRSLSGLSRFFNLPANISVNKSYLLHLHVLPLQPPAAGATPKLDHQMPMVFAQMAFIPKRQQKLAWSETLSLSWFSDSLPSLTLRKISKRKAKTRDVLCCAELRSQEQKWSTYIVCCWRLVLSGCILPHTLSSEKIPKHADKITMSPSFGARASSTDYKRTLNLFYAPESLNPSQLSSCSVSVAFPDTKRNRSNPHVRGCLS